MISSYIFQKEVNKTEVGAGTTHESYMLVNNNIDCKKI